MGVDEFLLSNEKNEEESNFWLIRSKKGGVITGGVAESTERDGAESAAYEIKTEGETGRSRLLVIGVWVGEKRG